MQQIFLFLITFHLFFICEHLTQKHSESVEDTTYERGIFHAFPVKPFQMLANSLPCNPAGALLHCSPAEVLLPCAPADRLLGNPAEDRLHCAPEDQQLSNPAEDRLHCAHADQQLGNPAEALLHCAPEDQLLGNRSLTTGQQPMKYLLPGMRERSLVVT